MNQEATKLVMGKIPAFKGFSFSQAFQFLRGGQNISCLQGQVLCREGGASTHMFILLAGALSIQVKKMAIARVEPVSVVGEMGLLTGMERCATIEVVEDATLIRISKETLGEVLGEKHELAAKFYQNMLDSLCRRLRQTNAQYIAGQPQVQPQIASLVT